MQYSVSVGAPLLRIRLVKQDTVGAALTSFIPALCRYSLLSSSRLFGAATAISSIAPPASSASSVSDDSSACFTPIMA